MQLTDWLVVVFVVAIVVVLIDGVRRKLAERRSRVVLKLDRNIPQDVDPEDLPNSELPNGGARALERDSGAVPSLRTLQARRKPLFKSHRAGADDSTARAVPVLLDTVDVEEERIEHTNVFPDPHAAEAFEADDFASAEGPGADLPPTAGRAARAPARQDREEDAEEFIDGLDEEYEEDAMLAEPTVARKEPGYMETRYQGRDDDDDDDLEDDEDEFDDEDEEDDEEEEEDFDELEDAEEFDEDDDEDDDEEEEDDLDDEDDDYDDDDEEDDEDDDDFDDDEEEDDEEEDDEDLDELGGLPEDDWGNEEEEGLLADDYENEPMPLQGAFDKAASQFDKVATHAASQLDKVATQAASQFDRVATQAASQFDKVASHAVNTLDKAATQAAGRFNRPPQADAPRIEPGFGDDVGGAESFDDVAFTEDFSAAFDDDDVAPVRESLAPRPERSPPVKPAAGKRDQGDLFPPRAAQAQPAREATPAREAPQENRLMAALQKAVPRSQPAPEPAAAPPVPQEVIIINVMARSGHVFHGGDLLGVLQEQGMRLGDMSIFHRHADNHGSGPAMFSMANMVKPGTFDLASMEDFDTPGVSFFLQMPNRLGNMACFEKMLATASAVRSAFDGELKDEHRSVFTRQTVEHCRQRVRDFELKLLSRK